jgi:DNA-binding NarL/FixJ family response regulator
MTDEPGCAPQRDAVRVTSTLWLARSVRIGNAATSLAAATELMRAGGSPLDIYDVVTSVLDGLAGRAGDNAAATEIRAFETVRHLVDHVPAPQPERRRGVEVVLALLPGEQHALGIQMLANVVRQHGYDVTLLLDTTWETIAEAAAACPQLAAVGLNGHDLTAPVDLRQRLGALRAATGDAAIVVGGHGVARLPQPTPMGADAVLATPRDLLVVLRRVTSPLSDRETEVLQAIADGMDTEGVAARLGVQQSTVREHVQRSFAKLSARTRAAAVAEALRRGLID